MDVEPLVDRAEVVYGLGGHLSHDFWLQKFGRTMKVTELWRYMWNSPPTFQRTDLFSDLTWCPWLEWGHYARLSSGHGIDHVWCLTLLLSKVTFCPWAGLPRHGPSDIFYFSERGSWVLEPEHVTHLHIKSLSILFDPFWLQPGWLAQSVLWWFWRRWGSMQALWPNSENWVWKLA